MINTRRLTTVEAAARLGVKPATLYAYVSRGVLSRERGPGGSTFDAAEIDRLALGARRPAARRAQPLNFVSELTLIDDGRLAYRGVDAIELSRSRTFEEVAGWLWAGAWTPAPEAWTPRPEVAAVVEATARSLPVTATLADRFRVAVAAAATADPLRHDLSPFAVAGTARGLVAAMVEALPPLRSGPADAGGIGRRLWARLTPASIAAPGEPGFTPDGGAAVLDAALVLLADHEMASSTVAARTAAMVGADPYAVAGAGLGVASGPYHAASSVEVVHLLRRVDEIGGPEALGEVLSRGRPILGFGHPLYPSGDPRAAELLARLGPPRGRSDAVGELLELASRRGMPAPNIDLALAALAHRTGMVEGAGEAIFVVARTAGWVAHAIEEYASRSWIRARATYVGSPPADR